MIYHHLVGQVDIATRAGVTPSAVRQWRTRHPDFPAAVRTVNGAPGSHGATPVWVWPDVRAWLQDTGRMAPDPF